MVLAHLGGRRTTPLASSEFGVTGHDSRRRYFRRHYGPMAQASRWASVLFWALRCGLLLLPQYVHLRSWEPRISLSLGAKILGMP